MAGIFGFGDHHHDEKAERHHLTNLMIVAFGVAFLLLTGYAVATDKIAFEGSFKAADMWATFVVLLSGLFGWVMRGEVEKRRAQGKSTS